MLDDASAFWWENITGPRLLIEEIAHCLSDGVNVVLHLSDSLVWKDQLPDLVRHHLEDAVFHTLTWPGLSRNEVVLWLLRNICPRKENMCPGEFDSQMRYLQKERPLANCIGWIIAQDTDDVDSLVHFLNDNRKKSLTQDGAFVLEVPPNTRVPPVSGRVRELYYDNFIHYGDNMLYASILADANTGIPPALKNYAASVTASLTMGSVELIPDMIQSIHFESEEPTEALLKMWEDDILPRPAHIPEREEMDQRVWRAQLLSAFSGIEMERLLIVGENAQCIEEALFTEYYNPKQDRTGYIWQRDDILRTASDVELGTLVWMMSLRRNMDRSQFLLYFPDPALRDWIVFLTDCRNNLAHHRLCTPEQMYHLLTNLRS